MKMEAGTFVVFALNSRDHGVGEVGRKTLYNNRYARLSWASVPDGFEKPDKVRIGMIVAQFPAADKAKAAALADALNALDREQSAELRRVATEFDEKRKALIGKHTV